ncbi:MAG: hypothetical protein QM703_01515 [Gemmatales bacterium]
MAPDATQEPLNAPKPRRWFRRRGWQIILLVVVCFAGWITWVIHDANEQHALLDKLQRNFNCVVQYDAPNWARVVTDSTWLSQDIRTWLFERVRFPVGFEFEEHENNPIDKELLSQIAARNWPSLHSIQWDDVPVENGKRLLLPLNCSNLGFIRLRNCKMTDELVEQVLSKCPKLFAFDLSNESISGRGLQRLRLLPQLQNLELRACKLHSLDFLQGVSTLSVLDLSGTTITDEHLMSIQDCERLDTLRLQGTSITGAVFASLPRYRHLRQLWLNRTRITDESMKYLPAFEELEHLDLSETNISGRNLFATGSPPKLKYLILNKTKVQLHHLVGLKGNASVQEFQVDETPCTDEGCDVLSTMPSLWQISFRNTFVGDKLVHALRSAQKLSSLGLKNTRITDACGASIREMPHLSNVDVENTGIGNRFFEYLIGHPTLTSISLRKTKADDQAVPYLLQLPHLVNIHVSPEQFSNDALKRLEDRGIIVDTMTDEEAKEFMKYDGRRRR